MSGWACTGASQSFDSARARSRRAQQLQTLPAPRLLSPGSSCFVLSSAPQCSGEPIHVPWPTLGRSVGRPCCTFASPESQNCPDIFSCKVCHVSERQSLASPGYARAGCVLHSPFRAATRGRAVSSSRTGEGHASAMRCTCTLPRLSSMSGSSSTVLTQVWSTGVPQVCWYRTRRDVISRSTSIRSPSTAGY